MWLISKSSPKVWKNDVRSTQESEIMVIEYNQIGNVGCIQNMYVW